MRPSSGRSRAAPSCMETRRWSRSPVIAQAGTWSPTIAFQMPIYPVTDFSTETESYRLYGKGFGLDTEDMLWFWRQYLRTDEDGMDPYASPLRAKDFRGLPPAFVMTAGLDPLRDEGEAYGEMLKTAGVSTKIQRVEDMPHGFISLPFGSEGRATIAAELRSVFAGNGLVSV
jgi:acetyl esterase